MTKGFSRYLDLIRFCAAFFVVLSHLAYPRFSGESLKFLRDWDYARDAVILFFVLSGLVIAFVVSRDGSWKRYTFNRATRLYSVLVPALFLTLLFDSAGQHVSPSAYEGWWYEGQSLGVFFASGFSFSNEWIFGHTRLGTNGPLWSLSYEAAYYILFGLLFFLKGWLRALLVIGAAVLIGPRVLLLLPAWLVGVWVWETIKEGAGMSHMKAALLVVIFPAFYFASINFGLHEDLSIGGRYLAAQLMPAVNLWFSDAYLWHNFMACVFGLHLVGMAHLLGNGWFARGDRVIRWLAGASFTIYVLHYPLLQFLHAAIPPDLPMRPFVLISGVLAGCFLIAEITERRLSNLRALLPRMRAGHHTA